MAPKDKAEAATATRTYDIYAQLDTPHVDENGAEQVIQSWLAVGQSIGRNHKDALRQFASQPDTIYLVVTSTSSQRLTTKTKTTTTVSDA